MKRIVLEDYRFKLGVKQYQGIIHAEQGIPMFYVPGEGVVARLTFPVSAYQYEEPFTACIRNGEDEVILELDTDDILLADIREDILDVTENYAYLQDFLGEKRVEFIPGVLKWISGAILTGLAAVVAFFLKSYYIAGAALLVTVIQGLCARSILRVVTDTIVYDKRGRWVDTATWQTNLNGGYQLRVREWK